MDSIAKTIFMVFKPKHMIEKDWDSGAILGEGDLLRKRCEHAASKVAEAFLTQEFKAEDYNRCFFCGTSTQLSEKGQKCPKCGGRPA